MKVPGYIVLPEVFSGVNMGNWKFCFMDVSCGIDCNQKTMFYTKVIWLFFFCLWVRGSVCMSLIASSLYPSSCIEGSDAQSHAHNFQVHRMLNDT